MTHRSTRVVLTGLSVLALGLSRLSAEEPTGVHKGSVELSSAASFSFSQESGDGNDDLTAIQLPLRVGYLITDRIGLEGEILLSHLDFGDDDPATGFVGSASLAFHFSPKARTTVFLLAGGGAGNAVEFATLAADSDTTVTTLHAGLGLKTFLGRRAALRVEYRFTHYSGDEPDLFSPAVDLNSHKLLIGFSVFFR
jgi:opacity protein-like surface antigen